MMGHDPAKNFNERLIAHMAEQKVSPSTSHKVASEPPFPEDDDDPEMEGERP
jgi:HPr kinase/phosphorylase